MRRRASALLVLWLGLGGPAAADVGAGGFLAPAARGPAREPERRFISEAFARAYDQKVAAYCAARGRNRAEAAYEIGWLLLNARKGERASGWLQRAAELGHERAAALLDRVPQARGAPLACPALPPAPAAATARPLAPPPAQTRAMARRLAPRYGLDPDLVLAVIAVESGFRADAVSPKNAQGLMQLIPETAERFNVADAFDPAQNIRGGARYLSWLLETFEGDLALALAGYNAGENAVKRHGGIPPFAETQNYVKAVQDYYLQLKAAGGAAARGGKAKGRGRQPAAGDAAEPARGPADAADASVAALPTAPAADAR